MSMVTPFAGVHIFWAVLLSHFWLKEAVGRWELVGSSFVICGVLLMVLFSGKETEILSLQQMKETTGGPLALAYISLSAAAAAALVILSHKLIPVSLGAWEVPVQRLSLALASGVFGGNTNVSAKVLTIAATQLFKGDLSLLRRFEAIYVIPTTNSCLVAEGILGAIMLLRETPASWLCFLFGVFLCLLGILVLTIKHKSNTPIKNNASSNPPPRPVEEPPESYRSWAPSSEAVSVPPR
ncbi:hypothetical protein, conserved [Eimeria brunetti]|uniref:Uncharacterized protein n=1 Tax=Eimeria brunetti TaxID=51314 RepID=U6LGP5_9EIME|nr:hypothetical protein, conserved [Eimeria brunetti]